MRLRNVPGRAHATGDGGGDARALRPTQRDRCRDNLCPNHRKADQERSINGLDVKNKSLTPRDFRGSVRGPRGLRGLTGPAGPQGAPGAAGASGAPRSAAACAKVNADGTVDEANSKNVANANITGEPDVPRCPAARPLWEQSDSSGYDRRSPSTLSDHPFFITFN